MSLSHFSCDSTLSTESPITFTLRLSNSGDLGYVAKLGGAHRREILRVTEQHAPRIAQPIVELVSPWVVAAVKSGAVIARRTDMLLLEFWVSQARYQYLTILVE